MAFKRNRTKPATKPEPPTGPQVHYEVGRIVTPLWGLVALVVLGLTLAIGAKLL